MKQHKNISMSIRFSAEELNRLKKAAELSSYGTFSEFVRRTALIEAEKVIMEKKDNYLQHTTAETAKHEDKNA